VRSVRLFAAATLLAACAEGDVGILEIRVVDAGTGREIPARLDLVDSAGEAWIPPEALLLSFECYTAPLPGWLRELSLSQGIRNRAAGTEQFYLDGAGRLELPPGSYRVRAFKGIEYGVASQQVEIRAGETRDVRLELARWIDMPARGWYSADDHVHVTRRTPEDDRRIGAWMRAEDLDVASLLQMGTVDQFGVTPQHDFGAAGEFRRDETLLVSGQEHPRTHFLGHTITLGADAPIDLPDTYIVYETFWRASRLGNGLSGFAHWGLGPARDGLAIDAPRGLVFFLEVLQFEFPHYEVWYELLDLGLRLTPTAGTDFPCGTDWGVPGRERFYTRLAERPTRESWLAGVRAGRTFVTNGPLLDLRMGEAGIGEELRLSEATVLPVAAWVRFDPARDDVQRVELLRNGEPIAVPVERRGPGELRLHFDHEVEGSAWYALRVSGSKLGETPIPKPLAGWMQALGDRVSDFREPVARSQAFYSMRERVRPSAAHSAPIYVSVDGLDEEREYRASVRARAALARLEELEVRLTDEHIEDTELWDWVPYSDAVSVDHLRRNRLALLRAIGEARTRYEAIGNKAAGPPGSGSAEQARSHRGR
jgi:hypothetical protein